MFSPPTGSLEAVTRLRLPQNAVFPRAIFHGKAPFSAANTLAIVSAAKWRVIQDALAPFLLRGGKLQVGVLAIRGDPRIADFHGRIVSLISGTAKPLIYQGLAVVSKILISGTARPELDALTAKHLSR